MPARSTRLIMRVVWLDFARRKDFFVLLSLVVLFAIGALSARVLGVEDESAARLLLSCGLGLASTLSAVLVALFASRMLPEELEARTLYPLLAKPLSRAQLLWGKFMGVASIGAASLVLFTVLAWLPVPKSASMSLGLLVQAVALQMVVLAGMAWLAMWLSIRWPAAVCAMAALGAYFAAGSVMDLAANALAARSQAMGSLFGKLASLAPDWTAMRFFQSYAEGAPALSFAAFIGLAAYGAAFAAAFAILCMRGFEKKAL